MWHKFANLPKFGRSFAYLATLCDPAEARFAPERICIVIDKHIIAGARLRIDLDALVDNYRAMSLRVAPARVAAVVKADGYGLGAIEVARALESAGCQDYCVAHLSEAIVLRRVLACDASIFVLNGLQSGAEVVCAEIGAIPVLNSLDQLDRWTATARATSRELPAVLQVDSGMSRLGLSGDEVEAVTPARLAGIDLRLIMSHLACADEPGAAANVQQLESFERIAALFPNTPRSLDNSGGAFEDRGHFDLVRIGIALYGGAPRADLHDVLQPVVALDARIIQVRDIAAEAGVGYGFSFRAETPRRIATIGVGYADGWPRHLSNRGAAYVDGIRVPIVGHVSMDSMTLDVTDVPDHLLAPGAWVELLGSNQTISDVASDAGTIAYEILTQLGDRYARSYRSRSLTA
jgi:alanine racemase